MIFQKLTAGLAITATLGLTACATQEQKLTESGATRLNKDQVIDYVVGNTEKWSKGGAYYKADGEMEAIWEGKIDSRTYSVSDNGELCIKGNRTFCHFYMNTSDGNTVMISDGINAGVKEMLAGNQLSNL